ncbi:MAG: MarR family transcriptional regulator [Actinomycetota bacterium]|nr:MarR family transcriptional regulator [Actinomycetota bacterium]
MTSGRRRIPAGESLADEVTTQAQALVLLWDRAEDWTVPRIPPSQLRVLTSLAWHGAMNLTRLAHQLGAIPSSASRLCDRLEAAGLLQRQISPGSRREVTLSLTGQGRRRLDAFAATRRGDFAAVLNLMSPAARTTLLDGLHQFSDAASQVLDSSAHPA